MSGRAAQLLAAVILSLSGAARASPESQARLVSGASGLPLADAWADAGRAGPRKPPLVQDAELAGALRTLVRGEASGLLVLGPLADSAREAIPSALHLPLAVSGVVLSANLPGDEPVNLSFEVLAAIELGAVRSWDDPAIKQLNPGRALPAWPITPLQRAEPADVTAVFSAALAERVPAFREQVGSGVLLSWPAGRRLRGAHALSLELSMVRGALGYQDAVNASRGGTEGLVKIALPDSAGRFLLPGRQELWNAASGATAAEDGRVIFPTPAPAGAWPIAAVVYLVADPLRAPEAIRLARWAVDEGGTLALRAGYADLPPRLRKAAQEMLIRRQRLGLLSAPSATALYSDING
jgi:ABC-type phosphate transport system substrate-binding protein